AGVRSSPLSSYCKIPRIRAVLLGSLKSYLRIIIAIIRHYGFISRLGRTAFQRYIRREVHESGSSFIFYRYHLGSGSLISTIIGESPGSSERIIKRAVAISTLLVKIHLHLSICSAGSDGGDR